MGFSPPYWPMHGHESFMKSKQNSFNIYILLGKYVNHYIALWLKWEEKNFTARNTAGWGSDGGGGGAVEVVLVWGSVEVVVVSP